MPIYEYRCNECGNVVEVLVNSGAAPDQQLSCQVCSSSDMEKILSASAISMGGSSESAPSCCGIDSPCADPKRCCGI